MRHIYALCVLLLLTAPAYAAETLDEKVYDAGQQPPVVGTPSPSAPSVPTSPGGSGIIVVPSGPAGQQPNGDTIIVVPTTPGQQVPGLTPGQSVPESMRPENMQPSIVPPDALQKETPTMGVPPVSPALTIPTIPAVPAVPAIPAVPEIPKAPSTEKRDIIVTPVQPMQPTQPGQMQPVQPMQPNERKEGLRPKTEERVILTPADFLPLTPNTTQPKDAALEPSKTSPKSKILPQKDKQTPEKAQNEAKPETKPETKPEASKDPKDSKESTNPKDKKDPKDSKDKKDPKKEKPSPEKKKPTREAKKGDIMRIPPDAAKTGDLSFLEGCWKGMVSGADGGIHRENMASRVCFDDKGKGQNSLHDPGRNETCVGPAKGVVSGDNLMRVDYDKVQCPSGKTWYPQGDGYMTCRDAGTGAACFAYFDGEPKLKFRFYKD